jgi:hypothetical protein
VVLHSSPKLYNLLYPSNAKVPNNNNTTKIYDTMIGVLRTFQLEQFGTNAGANIVMDISRELLDGRDINDIFFRRQSLFLMNSQGITMRKQYGSKTWRTLVSFTFDVTRGECQVQELNSGSITLSDRRWSKVLRILSRVSECGSCHHCYFLIMLAPLILLISVPPAVFSNSGFFFRQCSVRQLGVLLLGGARAFKPEEFSLGLFNPVHKTPNSLLGTGYSNLQK